MSENKELEFQTYMEKYLYKQHHPELFEERKPKFQIGDVVQEVTEKYEQDIDWKYFIREVTLVDNGLDPSEYVYTMSPIFAPEARVYTFKEDVLELEYHDSNWEEYAESVKANLPAWRGYLYNLYGLYVKFGSPKLGFINEASDYYNDTIPPAYMEHILGRHTIYGRLEHVISSNREEIMKNLNLTQDELNVIIISIESKIEKRNGIGYRQGDDTKFTTTEIKLAHQIDLFDIESRNGKKEYVDHFRLDLTNIDIMRMIKQAYESAIKVSPRELNQSTKDRRTGNVDDYQNQGKIDYEGITKDGTIIRFTYDFDQNAIDTAYPIKMNNNAKKH